MTAKNSTVSETRGHIFTLSMAAVAIAMMINTHGWFLEDRAAELAATVRDAPELFVVSDVPPNELHGAGPDPKSAFVVSPAAAQDITQFEGQLPALCVQNQDGSYEVFFTQHREGEEARSDIFHQELGIVSRTDKLAESGFCDEAMVASAI